MDRIKLSVAINPIVRTTNAIHFASGCDFYSPSINLRSILLVNLIFWDAFLRFCMSTDSHQ